ncbi:hypothetical protein N9878_00675 [bacterium]|nr:hypothetical protein [bacterium]
MNYKQFRTTHGLTQAQLAKLLHVSVIGVKVAEKRGTITFPVKLALHTIGEILKRNDLEYTQKFIDGL